MKRICFLLVVAAIVICLAGAASATEYFVATNGNDANPGTIDQPWQHVAYGVQQLSAGDTLNVRAGVYDEHLYIDTVNGEPGAYITIQSYDGDLAAVLTDYVDFYARQYMKLIGFEISGGTNTVHIEPGRKLNPRSQYIYIQRCYVHDSEGGDAIKVNQSDYIFIEDCEVVRGADQVIDFVWVNHSAVRRSYLHDFLDAGFYCKGGSLYDVVEDCVLSHALDSVTIAMRFGGTTDKRFRNPDSSYSSEYCVFRNNVIRDAERGANGTYETWYAYFYNNTIHNCGSPNYGIIMHHADPPVTSDGGSRHLFYYNNVFLDTDGDMGAVYYDQSGQPYEDWQHDYNNFWNAGNPIPSSGMFDPNQEPHSTFGNPNLANPTGTATTWQGWVDLYRITSASTSLIDKGTSSAGDDPQPAVHYDIEGTPRPQGSGWDIGAYEYVGGPMPPVADFSGNPTSGYAPLTVDFTDLSTGSPTSWDWSFGDTGTSTAQNPSHDYTAVGSYTVALTATNAEGSDTETKPDYITVSEQPQTSCHVGAIDLVGQYKKTGAPSGRGYYADATITVHDQDCAVLEGVTVVTFTSPVNADGGTFTCTVDNLTKSGYPYSSGDNHETSDSIQNP